MNEQYIQNIQKSSAVIVKENREMMGDEKNKIIIMWTPRAGCTITCHALFDLLGLRDDALELFSHIHDYRMKYFLPYAKPINISAIKNENDVNKSMYGAVPPNSTISNHHASQLL